MVTTLQVFLHLERHSSRPYVANFFVKVAPRRMRHLVTRHRLFHREIIFYRSA